MLKANNVFEVVIIFIRVPSQSISIRSVVSILFYTSFLCLIRDKRHAPSVFYLFVDMTNRMTLNDIMIPDKAF